MKELKRLLACLLAFVMLSTMLGCQSKQLTTEELIIAVNENMNNVKSFDAVMDVELDIEMMGQRQQSKTTVNMTSFSEPLSIKMDIQIQMMGATMPMQIYLEENDGGAVVYSNAMNEWTKSEIQPGEFEQTLGQYDAKRNLDIFVKNAKNFTALGVEQVNGVQAQKIEGFLAGEDLSRAIIEADTLESLVGLGMEMTVEDLNAMFENLGDLPMTIWVDDENLLTLKFQFDMSKVLDALYKNLFAAMDMDEQSIVTHNYMIEMLYSNIDNATAFTIPEEAKNAA